MTRAGGFGVALFTVLFAPFVPPAIARAQADRDFRYDNPGPAFSPEQGPTACFDAAHHNFHTANDLFWPYAELLRGDGFTVRQVNEAFTSDTLAACDVLVIATPVHESNRDDWSFPHPSAFGGDEIAAVFGWVNAGGGLLLVADHSPIPGALADLGAIFGVAFFDGEARNTTREPLPDVFRIADGTMAEHTITRGRTAVDEVDAVATWMGAAFRASREFEPLLIYGPESRAWPELTETFPHLPREQYPVFEVKGWLAAAARDVGNGRLVVIGEASMCTAQRNDAGPWGMNTEAGAENPRFCLNVARWLSGARVNPVR